MKLERRFFTTELRAESQGDEMNLVGYASVFGSQSEDLGGFREMVMPGAFARSIRENNDVKFLMNHDPNFVMGRVKNGTLKLEEDPRGLKFRAILPNTQAAKDLFTLVKRGDMDQCSFAFTAREQSWEDLRDGNGDMYANRKLMDVDLMDVSAVTYPAYSATSVSARFSEEALVEVRSAVDGLKAKRGSENQPPHGEGVIDNPNPMADQKLRDAWLKAFNDKFDELKKKGGKGWDVKEAIGFAISAANLAVMPDTETPPGVKGQKGKDPTPIPHTVVNTYGESSFDSIEVELRHDEAGNPQADIRVYKSAKDVPDYVPADKKAQWKEVWNSAFKKAKKDGKSDDDAEKSAFAQANGVAGPNSKKRSDEVSDPDSPDYDPDDPEYDPDWRAKKAGPGATDPNKEVNDAELDEANRAGKKTKKVAGKDLTSDKFAYVGDPNDTSTWKLPVHDEGHARNALARFNQTKGIPADKKDAVYKKIVAAAKKFGIQVSEKDSLRCGYTMLQTEKFLGEIEAEERNADEQTIRDGLERHLRLIEIDLN